MGYIAALFLILLVAAFVVGEKYGRAAEQELVGRVLAEYDKADFAVRATIQRILGSLKQEYSTIYNEAVAEADKLKQIF